MSKNKALIGIFFGLTFTYKNIQYTLDAIAGSGQARGNSSEVY